ncbi:asparaginase [uncultured Mitsuokella sp.]|uniref:asparaginase n=1 Tax=uncultured Mitsuokella sp. TaxID=453120 RepID=UPI0025E26C13|nr:asparaginase [uncultured Mitsuokella sp.]
MKKIVAITTGGTIAMKLDLKTGGLVPAVSGEDLLAAVPALKNIAEVEVIEQSNVPSGHITPQMMFDLSKKIDELAKSNDVDGFVVTHGTDTLEETAYMLDLTLHTDKPVCVTGAMRGASDTSWDGPGNILAAVKTAACDDAVGQGVLVVLNDVIHAAGEVTKTHSVNTDTFQSPWWGPVGHVYFDKVVFRRKSICRQKIQPERLVPDVYLIKSVAGLDDFLFKCLIDKKVGGIVVEAFGCGNVPLGVRDGIFEACKAGIPVVLTTRVHAGRVAQVYSYKGSAGEMYPHGIILAGELTGQKARLKLMLALGLTKDTEKLRRLFA